MVTEVRIPVLNEQHPGKLISLQLRAISGALWLAERAISLLQCAPIESFRKNLVRLKYRLRSTVWDLLLRKYPSEILLIKRGAFSWTLPIIEGPINKGTFVHDSYNNEEMNNLFAFLKNDSRFLKSVNGMKLCFDIGANIGTSSILLAKSGFFSKIYAIEPDPFNYYILSRNVAINKVEEIVEVFNCAISDRNGRIEFELSPDNCGDHRVVLESTDLTLNDMGEDKRSTIHVECKTFDEFLLLHGIDISNVGLIWIDVQGHEGHALGKSAVLCRNPVPIYCEFWPFGLKRSGGLDLFINFAKENYFFFIDFSSPGLMTEPSSGIDGLLTEIKALEHKNLFLF